MYFFKDHITFIFDPLNVANYLLFQVNDYLDELAEKFDTVTVATAGRSIEGRDIKYLKISSTNFEVIDYNYCRPLISI